MSVNIVRLRAGPVAAAVVEMAAQSLTVENTADSKLFLEPLPRRVAELKRDFLEREL